MNSEATGWGDEEGGGGVIAAGEKAAIAQINAGLIIWYGFYFHSAFPRSSKALRLGWLSSNSVLL